MARRRDRIVTCSKMITRSFCDALKEKFLAILVSGVVAIAALILFETTNISGEFEKFVENLTNPDFASKSIDLTGVEVLDGKILRRSRPTGVNAKLILMKTETYAKEDGTYELVMPLNAETDDCLVSDLKHLDFNGTATFQVHSDSGQVDIYGIRPKDRLYALAVVHGSDAKANRNPKEIELTYGDDELCLSSSELVIISQKENQCRVFVGCVFTFFFAVIFSFLSMWLFGRDQDGTSSPKLGEEPSGPGQAEILCSDD